MTSSDSEKHLSELSREAEMSCTSEFEGDCCIQMSPERTEERVRMLEREKEEWMRKYFALLAEKEGEEGRVAQELATLEQDVQSLSERVFVLTAEKRDLSDSLSSLLSDKSRLQRDLVTQQSRWNEEMKSLKRAVTREREACAYELASITEQFAKVRTQFENYKRTMQKETSPKVKRRESKLSLTQPIKKMMRTMSADRSRMDSQRKLAGKATKCAKKKLGKACDSERTVKIGN